MSFIQAAGIMGAVYLLLAGQPAWAGQGTIYYYQDESGTHHFTDLPTSQKYRPFAFFGRTQEKTPGQLEQSIVTYSRRYQVDPDLIRAMIQVESNFDARAVSLAGAQGLMQIMPETQKDLGLKDPFDADSNVEAGVRYYRWLLNRFQDTELALAAYNAGPSRVEKYGGIPPFEETVNYVDRVLDIYNNSKQVR
ncbi:Lytic transglycosylase catalytic [Desulfonatronospira thiodismutans ASO3-1]|uniref:Lytic transglycosylase catalytic n=1 Tax=Desulfonatronospira thiodismutans ASO3-1 TaxID=555779 RepID=D6STE0_9BACT|nr:MULTISPECIES: transglycosylase SLT domain-containing protein [Desulfonatronospira]EFI33956.1 Lytic transglycosylase catalytic [Desulfonatronospira thiodismutans ASO3-1]RQD75230.1 MAG: lytic transglycosylase domain-containing protein [Desulfonatronospira sp. MSAO_Bac3]